jgi:HSP20 family molecular chaperone IbpA
MRSYDLSPLWRSTIGFDRLFDLAETAQRAAEDNYPPYNIERLATTAIRSRSPSPASRRTKSR